MKTNLKKTLSIIFLFLVFPNISFAIFLNKNSYTEGDPIIVNGGGGPVVLFDSATPDPTNDFFPPEYPIFNVSSYLPDWILNLPDDLNPDASYFTTPVGQYTIVELNDSGTACFVNFLTYSQCLLAPEFVSGYSFSVNPIPSGGGGGGDPVLDEELAPAVGARSITSYSPEISILSSFKDMLFSKDLNIDYKVTDNNDSGNEKSQYGLAEKPVAIYFSDKITNWYDNYLGFKDKTEIAKDQPKEGKYVWSVKDLVPGVLYKIVVEAIDLAGVWSQNITDFFGVDFTSPVFTVSVNPNIVRSGDVTIKIDSSEDLGKIPEVKVTQNGAEAKTIEMKGEKSHYEGKYTVIGGYDGPAFVSIVGVDLAGNVSTEIVSGGTFSIGVNPPPKPKIDNYVPKIVTNKGFIDISGSVRSDTEVVLKVNGIEISKSKGDSKGKFTLNKITLDKKKNKGINYIDITSRDLTGSISESVLIEVKYNIAPTVAIIKPLNKDIISSATPISVEGLDENGDTIFYTYQALSQASFDSKIYNWITVSESNPSSTFVWDTTEFDDGNYVIQVIADDTNAKTVSSITSVNIKNVLPYFRFEDGRSTISNKDDVVVKGKALTSVNVSPRPNIISVAYSMDSGKTWSPVKITTGSGQYEKKFAVSFASLKEGKYPILWRTKDSRSFIGKVVHPIVIDKTSPKVPVVTSPRLEKEILINDDTDENLSKSGVQISVKGNTEASSVVTLVHEGKTITSKSLPTGAFLFNDVTFTQKGKYILDLYVTDSAGNKSSTLSLSILYNNPPVISFISPKPFRGISSKSLISWSIKDKDNGKLTDINISYRNSSTSLWKDLVLGVSAVGVYVWDTKLLPESNNYELKITASDGNSSVFAIQNFSIDHTAPTLDTFNFSNNKISFDTDKVSFVADGTASDNLSGIEFVEYMIEKDNRDKSPWYKGIVSSGFLKNKAAFTIKHPVKQNDGSYKVYARAVDSSGNTGEPLSLSVSVDKTVPRIGGFFISKNNIDLSPDEDGNIPIYKNTIFTFSISLEEDTTNASLKIGNKDILLEKDIKNNLWSADISVSEEEKQDLFISASDISGNKIKDKAIGSVSVSSRGVINTINSNSKRELIAGASISVLKLNNHTKQFEDFTTINNNTSSVLSNESGEYDLVLPAGVYRLVIKNKDFNTYKSEITLIRSSLVNNSFELSKISSIWKFIYNFFDLFK